VSRRCARPGDDPLLELCGVRCMECVHASLLTCFSTIDCYSLSEWCNSRWYQQGPSARVLTSVFSPLGGGWTQRIGRLDWI